MLHCTLLVTTLYIHCTQAHTPNLVITYINLVAKLPELETEAPMKNATITKSRAPRPARTHRVTRPSQMVPSSDLIDAPSTTLLEEPSPTTSPAPVSPKSPVSKSPLIPGKSPAVSPTPG